MKKTVQKAASLLLSLLFLLALVPTASALNCNHASHGFRYVTKTEYTYLTPNQCQKDEYIYKECYQCRTLYDGVLVSSSRVSHQLRTYSASCNGRMQSINRSCINCYYDASYTQTCPNAPHTGNCTALPLSVGPEVTIK